MARFEKEDFENADVNMASTVEFNKLLKFIHFYNKEKALNPQGAILDEVAFATDVCNKAGFIGGTALAEAYLKRVKILNQRTGSYSVPDASQEKQLCTDFREYVNAKIDAKKKDLEDKEKEVEKEEKYAQEYDIKAKEVGSARRSVWWPFAKWGAIGLAGTIVLTAILPAVAGITALGGLFSTGFTGLATLATGLIGGFQGFGGRYSAYKKAKNDLARSRRPKLAELEAEKETIENELKNLESEFKNKDSAMSRLNVMNAEDQAEIRTKIQEIYNEVVAQNKDYVDNGKYITSGIGKGESDRVHAEMDRLVQELNALMLDPNVDAQKLKEAQDKKAQADLYNVANIRKTAEGTANSIFANEAIINNLVSTLPDSIKNDANINNKVNGVLTQISGFNDTNKVLHENDTQKQLEQAERAIKKEVILLNADLAKSWINENGSLNDGNPKKAEYDAIAKAIGDGGSYQNHLKNNNNILADPTKSDAEKERAQREVEKVGTLTSLLLIKARLYRALEESNAHTIRGKFKDINGIKVPQSDFLKSINGEIDRVNDAFEAFRDAGTDPEFGVLAQEVSEIETNLANQIKKFEEEKKPVPKSFAKAKSNKKTEIRKLYTPIQIQIARLSASYTDIEMAQINSPEIKTLLEPFDETKANSYIEQIDDLTDLATFRKDAQNIIDSATAKRDEIIAKLEQNKQTVDNNRTKPDSSIADKKDEAKEKIKGAMNDFVASKNAVQVLINDFGGAELENKFTEAEKELKDAINSFVADVDSINDVAKLEQIIAGKGDFADYLAGLNIELDNAKKSAEITKRNCDNLVEAFFGAGGTLDNKIVELNASLKALGLEDKDVSDLSDGLKRIYSQKQAGILSNKQNYGVAEINAEINEKALESEISAILQNAKDLVESEKDAEEREEPVREAEERVRAEREAEEQAVTPADERAEEQAQREKEKAEIRAFIKEVNGVKTSGLIWNIGSIEKTKEAIEEIANKYQTSGETAKAEAIKSMIREAMIPDKGKRAIKDDLKDLLIRLKKIEKQNANKKALGLDDKDASDLSDGLKEAEEREKAEKEAEEREKAEKEAEEREKPKKEAEEREEPEREAEEREEPEKEAEEREAEEREVDEKAQREREKEKTRISLLKAERIGAFIRKVKGVKSSGLIWNTESIEEIKGAIEEIVDKYQTSGETVEAEAIKYMIEEAMGPFKDESEKIDELKGLLSRLQEIEKQNAKNNSSEAGDDEPQM